MSLLIVEPYSYPARKVVMPALGTQWLSQHTTFNQRADGLNAFNLVHQVCQNASLMRCQFLKFCRQNMEFFSFHRSTYLTDWYNDSIASCLTVT